ncbi:MAG TPA: hypothetical protein VKV17_08585 [Bryobacteraceae bacterium]|nr:hypothetical protein [Bryobacteraceae bacterium]
MVSTDEPFRRRSGQSGGGAAGGRRLPAGLMAELLLGAEPVFLRRAVLAAAIQPIEVGQPRDLIGRRLSDALWNV